jgi:hypothetical protein
MIRGGIVTLRAGDVGASVRFYVETLGMKLVEERADGSAVVDAGEGLRIGLRAGKRAGGQTDDVLLTLLVKVPLADAVAIYENRGVAFERTPSGVTFRDPANNRIALEA